MSASNCPTSFLHHALISDCGVVIGRNSRRVKPSSSRRLSVSRYAASSTSAVDCFNSPSPSNATGHGAGRSSATALRSHTSSTSNNNRHAGRLHRSNAADCTIATHNRNKNEPLLLLHHILSFLRLFLEAPPTNISQLHPSLPLCNNLRIYSCTPALFINLSITLCGALLFPKTTKFQRHRPGHRYATFHASQPHPPLESLPHAKPKNTLIFGH